jgi:hypothetical protein
MKVELWSWSICRKGTGRTPVHKQNIDYHRPNKLMYIDNRWNSQVFSFCSFFQAIFGSFPLVDRIVWTVYPSFADDSSIQCFNGAKSNFLGWYDDHSVVINPSATTWMRAMVGVDDFVTGAAILGQHTVVAKIEDSSST